MHNSGSGWLLRAAVAAMLAFCGRTAEASTTLVRAGENLQTAINAAQPGDTLLLEAGATFTGNFVLPVKTGTQVITIQTAGATGLPAPGARISPSHAPLLAKIRSGNPMPALRTAAGAHHWRLVLLEFPANRDGYGEIIQLGDGSSAQTQPEQVPFEIELDRVYIHGDPVMGQKRGIALNARNVTIRNCYISDIRAVGMDTQAIGGWNGPGPFLIENNYLEAAGENLMLGGAAPAIPNLVGSGLVFRHNYVSRPMSWRDPVVPAPTGASAAAHAGGSLSAGTYRYRIVARKRVSGGVTARSAASEEVSAVAQDGGLIQVTWTSVPHAADYQVYRVSPSGASHYWTVAGTWFNDSGAGGAAGTAPDSPGHTWTVKNLFELKNARNVLIEKNIFENHWAGAQAGYAIVLTPRAENGACSWCVVENVTIRQNVVRNVAGGINILGYDDTSPSQQTRRITIVGNLFTGLRSSLGGSGWFLLIGGGPRDIVVDHNTVDSEGNAVMYVYGNSTASVVPVPGFTFTNNAMRHGHYGINGAEASFGNGIISAFFPDGQVKGNWLQGGPASRYPAGNYFDGTFASAFVNVAGGDYRTAAGGPLAGRATDGTSIGADIEQLDSAVRLVQSGQMKRMPVPASNLRIVQK